METMTDRLDTWVELGLVTPEQAQRIMAYERGEPDPARGAGAAAVTSTAGGGPPTPPTAQARTDRRAAGRTSLAEGLGYVGAALALGAIGLLLGELWRELLVGGRLALVGVVTVAVFGAGAALRSATAPALHRLTNVLFAAGVAGVGWFTSVLTGDVMGMDWDTRGASVGAVMFVLALGLQLWRRGWLLQLAALFSALFGTGMALSVLDPQLDLRWYGLSFAAIGAAWVVLSRGGWLGPRVLGETTGALAVLLGVQVGGWGDARTVTLAIGVAIALLLVASAVHGDHLHHLVVGAIGLFAFSPQLVFELFGDRIGGPASLLLVGLLLVLLAVGVGRARREVGPEHAGGDSGIGAGDPAGIRAGAGSGTQDSGEGGP